MKVAYIAGPYRSRWPWPFRWLGVALNVYRARRVSLRYWRQGYAVICPHSNTAFFDGKARDAVWLAGYIAILRRCNVVVMMRGWRNSDGSVAEHNEARRLGKRIIYD